MNHKQLTFLDGINLGEYIMAKLIAKQPDATLKETECIVLEMFGTIKDDCDCDSISDMEEHFNIEHNSEYRFLRDPLTPIAKVTE